MKLKHRITGTILMIAFATTSALPAATIPNLKSPPKIVSAPRVPAAVAPRIPVVPKVVKAPVAPKVPVVPRVVSVPKVPAVKVPVVKVPVTPRIVAAPKIPVVKAAPKIPSTPKAVSTPKVPTVKAPVIVKAPAAAPKAVLPASSIKTSAAKGSPGLTTAVTSSKTTDSQQSKRAVDSTSGPRQKKGRQADSKKQADNKRVTTIMDYKAKQDAAKASEPAPDETTKGKTTISFREAFERMQASDAADESGDTSKDPYWTGGFFDHEKARKDQEVIDNEINDQSGAQSLIDRAGKPGKGGDKDAPAPGQGEVHQLIVVEGVAQGTGLDDDDQQLIDTKDAIVRGKVRDPGDLKRLLNDVANKGVDRQFGEAPPVDIDKLVKEAEKLMNEKKYRAASELFGQAADATKHRGKNGAEYRLTVIAEVEAGKRPGSDLERVAGGGYDKDKTTFKSPNTPGTPGTNPNAEPGPGFGPGFGPGPGGPGVAEGTPNQKLGEKPAATPTVAPAPAAAETPAATTPAASPKTPVEPTPEETTAPRPATPAATTPAAAPSTTQGAGEEGVGGTNAAGSNPNAHGAVVSQSTVTYEDGTTVTTQNNDLGDVTTIMHSADGTTTVTTDSSARNGQVRETVTDANGTSVTRTYDANGNETTGSNSDSGSGGGSSSSGGGGNDDSDDDQDDDKSTTTDTTTTETSTETEADETTEANDDTAEASEEGTPNPEARERGSRSGRMAEATQGRVGGEEQRNQKKGLDQRKNGNGAAGPNAKDNGGSGVLLTAQEQKLFAKNLGMKSGGGVTTPSERDRSFAVTERDMKDIAARRGSTINPAGGGEGNGGSGQTLGKKGFAPGGSAPAPAPKGAQSSDIDGGEGGTEGSAPRTGSGTGGATGSIFGGPTGPGISPDRAGAAAASSVRGASVRVNAVQMNNVQH